MYGVHIVWGGYEKCITLFWLESLKGRDSSKDLGLGGRIILDHKKLSRWTNLAQAVVNVIMRFHVS